MDPKTVRAMRRLENRAIPRRRRVFRRAEEMETAVKLLRGAGVVPMDGLMDRSGASFASSWGLGREKADELMVCDTNATWTRMERMISLTVAMGERGRKKTLKTLSPVRCMPIAVLYGELTDHTKVDREVSGMCECGMARTVWLSASGGSVAVVRRDELLACILSRCRDRAGAAREGQAGRKRGREELEEDVTPWRRAAALATLARWVDTTGGTLEPFVGDLSEKGLPARRMVQDDGVAGALEATSHVKMDSKDTEKILLNEGWLVVHEEKYYLTLPESTTFCSVLDRARRDVLARLWRRQYYEIKEAELLKLYRSKWPIDPRIVVAILVGRALIQKIQIADGTNVLRLTPAVQARLAARRRRN